MSNIFQITNDDRLEIASLNDGQLLVNVPFPFQASGDLLLILKNSDGETTQLILTQDYSVSGEGQPNGGEITLQVASQDGQKLYLIGQAVIERITSIVRDGRFSSAAIDADFDRLTIILLELARDLSRAVKTDFGQNGLQIEKIPKNHFYKSDGLQSLVDGGKVDDIAAAQSHAEKAIGAAQTAENILNDLLSRYIGAFASDSAADADNPIKSIGTLYFHTDAGVLRAWNGAGWTDPTLVLADGSVTNEKLAKMPQNTIKANLNFGTNVPQNVDLEQLKSALNTPGFGERVIVDTSYAGEIYVVGAGQAGNLLVNLSDGHVVFDVSNCAEYQTYTMANISAATCELDPGPTGSFSGYSAGVIEIPAATGLTFARYTATSFAILGYYEPPSAASDPSNNIYVQAVSASNGKWMVTIRVVIPSSAGEIDIQIPAGFSTDDAVFHGFGAERIGTTGVAIGSMVDMVDQRTPTHFKVYYSGGDGSVTGFFTYANVEKT